MFQQQRKIGAHVSAAGGVDKAVERVVEIGGNCVQVFSASPRVWQRPNIESIDFKKITSKMEELHVESIITHSMYLLNLASDTPDLVEKSAKAIAFDLQFDALVGGAGVVVHVGSHQGRGWEAVKEQVAEQIAQILKKSPPESHFLIENAAGQLGKVGGELAEIRWLLERVHSPQLGWCLDTCHAFASGYALGAQSLSAAVEEQKNYRPEALVAEINALNLWENLHVVHVNDSRDPFGSGRDRHANIGEGLIPQDDLRAFLNQPQLHDLPLILEVPGEEKSGPDLENMRRLRALLVQ